MKLEDYETTHEVAKRLKVSDSRIRHMLAEGRFPDAFQLTKSAKAPWLFPKGVKPTSIPEEKIEAYRAAWRKKHADWRKRQKEKK